MPRQYTAEQLQAIHARGGTLLVSAAAGSGKTSVLVERVIERILDREHPCDVDKLLVVTFSNAAAAEMKERVRERLSTLLREQPNDQYLKRQQMLLAKANISTVHAFCLKLVREQFQQLDIAPNMRIAEEGELSLLRRQAAEEVVGEFYEREDSAAFEQVVELFSGFRDDAKLIDTALTLYDFLCSHPFPKCWLKEKLSLYEDIPLADSIWGERLFEHAKERISFARELTEESLVLIESDDRLIKAYHSAYSQDLEFLTAALADIRRQDYAGLFTRVHSFSFPRLGALRNYEDEAAKARLKTARDTVKSLVSDLKERLLCCTEEEYLEDIRWLRPRLKTLFDLVQAFSERFSALKKEGNLMDFSDIEHFALRLLTVPEEGGYHRTPLARELSARFEEILVDEYQDTNEAQDTIFQAISREGANLFMVGDVKQSIYRFRQAMPELFLKKNAEYSLYDGEHYPAKILLHKNFRSRAGVTDGVNFFFTQLMSREMGEIDYNEEESLIAGAAYPAADFPCVTLHALDAGERAKEETSAEFEAQYVRELVEKILRSGRKVTDGGALRPVRPGDICILLRSVKGKAEVYAKALEEMDVPARYESSDGFFDSREISVMLALLKVLDNPFDDISMMAVLASELFSFSFDELAQLRLRDRYVPLCVNLRAGAQEGDARCKTAWEFLETFRSRAQTMRAGELIEEIYAQTLFDTLMAAQPNGQVRRANLRLLLDYTARFEESGYRGLSDFIRFLARLEEQGTDLAPANLNEMDNAVRIMSVHKSKGLEFPICILADLGKRFNKTDLNGQTLVHSQLGFATKRRDEQDHVFSTLQQEIMKLELENSMLSEEMRVLYVAMTRAKEALHLVVTSPDMRKKLEKLASGLPDTEKLPAMAVRSASGYGDWVLSAALRHPGGGELRKLAGVPVPLARAEGSLRVVLSYPDGAQGEEAAVEQPIPSSPADSSLVEEIRARAQYRYPYERETKTPSKVAVSEVAEQRTREQYAFTARPRFETGQALTPAQRGTVMHQFLQFMDFDAAEQDIQAEMNRLVAQRFFTPQEAEILQPNMLSRFFKTELYHRMRASGKSWRERRFLVSLDYGLCTGNTEDAGREVVVQGVCDFVFEEDGELVIVDYKTDRVRCMQELSERYGRQLLIYRKAMEKMTGKPVKECVLYSIPRGEELSLS